MAQYEMSDRRFWDERDRQMDAEIAAELAYAKTPEGRIARLESEVAALRNLCLESGIDHSDRIAVLEAEITTHYDDNRRKMAEAQAVKDAEWTLDVTVERRAIWNALVATGKYANKAGAVALYNRDAGFTYADLADAVDRHGLRTKK